jgi:hypothetical protein
VVQAVGGSSPLAHPSSEAGDEQESRRQPPAPPERGVDVAAHRARAYVGLPPPSLASRLGRPLTGNTQHVVIRPSTWVGRTSDLMRPEAAFASDIGSARGLAERLAETYERTVAAFEHSAALAEQHAQRLERTGRRQAAEDEHCTAEWARNAARRAHQAAGHTRERARRAQSSSREGPRLTTDPKPTAPGRA